MDNQKADISVELCGSVEDVIYKNAENGYTVLNLGCEEGLIPVDYDGIADDVKVGDKILLDDGKVGLEVLEIKDDITYRFSVICCIHF